MKSELRAFAQVSLCPLAFTPFVEAKSITVAVAYVMHKAPYVFPILGARKAEHLVSNLEALDISLTPEQIAYLESIIPFDKGFPTGFFVSKFFYLNETLLNSAQGDGTGYNNFMKSTAYFSKQPGVQPIAHVRD